MKLELPIEEVNLILDALGKLPHYQVRNLIDKIYQQGQPQAQAKVDETVPVIDIADLQAAAPQANGKPEPEPQPEATPPAG